MGGKWPQILTNALQRHFRHSALWTKIGLIQAQMWVILAKNAQKSFPNVSPIKT